MNKQKTVELFETLVINKCKCLNEKTFARYLFKEINCSLLWRKNFAYLQFCDIQKARSISNESIDFVICLLKHHYYEIHAIDLSFVGFDGGSHVKIENNSWYKPEDLFEFNRHCKIKYEMLMNSFIANCKDKISESLSSTKIELFKNKPSLECEIWQKLFTELSVKLKCIGWTIIQEDKIYLVKI